MPQKLPILRVAGPSMFVSLILFAACTAAAISLYRWHAASAEILTDDIDSRRVADQLEKKIGVLIDRLRTGKFTEVEPLLEDIQADVAEALKLSNTEEEEDWVNHLEQSLIRFQELWENREDSLGLGKTPTLRPAMRILETEARPLAIRLFNFNNQRIENSEAGLRRTVKWIAWGLVVVGFIGSLGGILFGYAVARALRQSIYQLSVRIRDAADRLRQDLPTVTIHHGDGIDYLHEQMQSLVREIDQVVERLHQREREVRRADQLAAVGQLAAGVAHELRNPLTAVKMLVQSSREDLEDRGVPAEDLQIIEQEIRRLEKCLQTFLDFARPPKMERRRVDLGKIIGEAFALVGGRARKQKVDLGFTPPDPPVELEADGDQLRQLLVNLALNSLDAMPSQGRLAVKVCRQPGGWVEVRVCDSGAGIAPEIRPRLFEPFASGKETGLGLGLVVSRRIAEDHGGELFAEVSGSKTEGQEPGGACFILRLPVLGHSTPNNQLSALSPSSSR